MLWAGIPKGINGANFYDIIVEPGNKLVRRKSDQMITATLTGFQAPQVRLRLRISFRGPAGACGILRGSGRCQIEDVQAGRGRSAGD
jgi:hypothetical protein